MTVIKNFSAGPSEWRPLGPFQETLLKDIKAIYSFISMKDALKDEAYQTEITIYNNWGISWLDRWALSQEKMVIFSREIR